MLTRQGPTVLDWLLHPDVGYCQSSASPICYPPSVALHHCSRFGRLAFSGAGPSYGSATDFSDQHWKHCSSQCTGTRSAVSLEAFLRNALQKLIIIIIVIIIIIRLSGSFLLLEMKGTIWGWFARSHLWLLYCTRQQCTCVPVCVCA